jgi:hypothetical protein
LRRTYRALAEAADALLVPTPDETFIVRARRREGDATVEQPRLSRQRQVQDIAEVGLLIKRWLGPTSVAREGEDRSEQRDDAGRPVARRPRKGSHR